MPANGAFRITLRDPCVFLIMKKKIKNLLIVFARNPVEGKVKTRLAKSIGNRSAANVYRRLLDHTKNVAGKVNSLVQVWYAGGISRDDLWSDIEAEKKVQIEGDLGEKMSYAFRSGFDSGFESIVIIGSDCLQLRHDHIEQAFLLLKDNDVVIGPSRDGGYYLLGMNSYQPGVFAGKSWSQPTLFDETVETLGQQQMSFAELEVLNDIDTIEDLDESSIDVSAL
jgi:uncharacterized protein